jgi:hypothetical protein
VTSPHATVEAVEQSWWPAQSRPNLRRWFHEREGSGRRGSVSRRQVPAPAGVVRVINEYLAAKSAHSPDRAMSFFDRGNTTYVDATLGWKFPT